MNSAGYVAMECDSILGYSRSYCQQNAETFCVSKRCENCVWASVGPRPHANDRATTFAFSESQLTALMSRHAHHLPPPTL